MWPRRSDGNSGRKVILMTTNDYQNDPHSTTFPGQMRFNKKKIAWMGGLEREILGKTAIRCGQNTLKRAEFGSKTAQSERIRREKEQV
jgi:hypothetical protein